MAVKVLIVTLETTEFSKMEENLTCEVKCESLNHHTFFSVRFICQPSRQDEVPSWIPPSYVHMFPIVLSHIFQFYGDYFSREAFNRSGHTQQKKHLYPWCYEASMKVRWDAAAWQLEKWIVNLLSWQCISSYFPYGLVFSGEEHSQPHFPVAILTKSMLITMF